MNKKVGVNKQVFGYICVFAILIVVAVYFLGVKKLDEKAAATKASNDVLEVSINELKQYKLKEAQYKADIETMKTSILAVLDKYPAGSRAEDVIMHAVTTQLKTDVVYENINIGSAEAYKVIPVETLSEIVLKEGDKTFTEEIAFVEQEASYANKLSYPCLKEAIQAVFDSSYKLGITSISYSAKNKDEPGILEGSIDISFYSMRGNGKEYVEPNILPYTTGSENIFGYYELYEAVEEKEKEEAEAEER